MKLITFIAPFTMACILSAADKPAAPADPFAGAFFPPEIIMLVGDQIGLTQEQREALHTRVEKAQLRSDEMRSKLERETAALSVLAKQDHVDEAALAAQLDRVLDAERELKHLHIGLLAGIKNLLSPEQQTKLRDATRDGGAKLVEVARRRLTEKVEQVKEGAQKWAASGRDPSAIARMMEEKVKPLLDTGKSIEAEAELDRVLELLKKDAQ